MILCNVCAGEINERMVCKACGTRAGAAYASAAAAAAAHSNVAYAPPSVLPAPTPAARRKGAGGKLAVALILLAAFAGLGWWGYAARERSVREQQQRELIETYGPLTVESVVLKNIDIKGNVLGGPTTTFARKDVRYVFFEAVIRNNAVGLYDFDGALDVKYINPSGKVENVDSQGFSLHRPLTVSSASRVVPQSGSLGNQKAGELVAGKWQIEFWFRGRKIGGANFTVY